MVTVRHIDRVQREHSRYRTQIAGGKRATIEADNIFEDSWEDKRHAALSSRCQMHLWRSGLGARQRKTTARSTLS